MTSILEPGQTAKYYKIEVVDPDSGAIDIN